MINYSIFWALVTMGVVFSVSFMILFGVLIYLNHKHKKHIEDITMYQIHTSAQIDSSIPEILDLIIQESFTDYQVKYLTPANDGYINSEREAEIRKELVAVVTSRISSAAIDKISLFYNIKNIADIIADKIYILVMNYVIDHNENLGA